MKNNQILSIQDLSCFGQCSNTVSLPILSSFGFQVSILPTYILSTHTGGFKNYKIVDFNPYLKDFITNWEDENIKFDYIYSGYLGNKEHVDIIKEIIKKLTNKDFLYFFDPAFGDNGNLYYGFNDEYVNKMKELINLSNIILPNLTEACYLTNSVYKDNYDESYIKEIINKLIKLGAKEICLTGISFKDNRTGIYIYSNNEYKYYEHIKISKGYHGTGDLFASVFIGSYLKNKDIYKSSKIAGDFIVEAINNTNSVSSHWYGVKFEELIKNLLNKIED